MKAIDRLYKYFEFKGVKPTPLEKELGFSNGYFSRQKKNQGELGEGVIYTIIKHCPDLNIEWLIMGRGEMLLNTLTPIEETLPVNEEGADPLTIHRIGTDYYRPIDKQEIPLYELEGVAGLTPIFNNQVKQIPIDFISIPNAPRCDGAIYVRGDSMYPILKAGDIVCYKTINDIKNIYWGEMYLLDIDNDGDDYLTFKYVQKSELGDDYVKLVSHNPHHSPKDELIKNIRSLALVKLSIRFNSMR